MTDLDRGHTAYWNFEVAWEIVNKVGGIYSVIRSKAEELGDKLCLLGPYKEHCALQEVEEMDFQKGNPLACAVESMRKRGYKIVTGRWLVDGNPQLILFDISSGACRLDQFKSELWERTSIGVPYSDTETNNAVILGYMIAEFMQEFKRFSDLDSQDHDIKNPRIVSHFHEWQAGVGLIAIHSKSIDITTVFTIRATLLGGLCADNTDFHKNLSSFRVDEEAGKRQIYHKHCIERAATHLSHVFTTVSEITGYEAEHLLKRKPDIITPNGLNVKKFFNSGF